MTYPFGGRSNSLETAMNRYFFCDDTKKIIYHGTEFSSDPNLIYLGTSDNANWAMAAQVFTKNMKIDSGYKLKRLD